MQTTKKEVGEALPYTKDKKQDNQTKVIDNQEIEKRREIQRNNKKRIILICIALAVVVFLIIFFAVGGYEKILDLFGVDRDVAVTPTVIYVEAETKGDVLLEGNEDTTIVYDEQGVTGYGADGKWKWNEMCSVSNPSITDCGNFSVVADIGGTAAYAFDKNGSIWKYGNNNIIKSVFGAGKYVCIIHDEEEYLSAATVYEYDSKTSSLKELFIRKFSSHYMITGAISEDGKQLVLSGVFSDGGSTSGIISFIKMSDGEIFSTEVIPNNIYIKVFFANNNVFAANSDSVKVLYKSMTVSSSEDNIKECWGRDNMQNSIIDATLVNNKYCVISVGNDNSEKTTLKGFDTNAKEVFNIEVPGNVIGMDSEGDTFMAYTNTHVYMYTNKGFLLGSVEAGFEIEHAICAGSRHVTAGGDKKLLAISFE